MRISIAQLLVVAALVLTCGAQSSAQAACFESGIGCTDDHYLSRRQLAALSCDALWTVRNTIYHERGYCFRTERAIGTFSNDGCTVSNARQLAFNAYERANIDRIVAVESSKGCR